MHGVDAATYAGVTLAPEEWLRMAINEPPATSLKAQDAAAVRLRCHIPAAEPRRAPVEVEMSRGGQPLLFSCHAERMTAASAIYFAPFNPGDVVGTGTLEVKITSKGQVAIVLEEVDVVYERDAPGIYRSGWRSLPPLSEFHRRMLEVRQVRWAPTFAHYVPESAPGEIIGGRWWEIRVRDGAHPTGSLYFGTMLAGGHWGSAAALPLASDPEYGVKAATKVVEVDAGQRTLPRGLRRKVRVKVRATGDLASALGDLYEGLVGIAYGDALPMLVSVYPAAPFDHVTTMVARMDAASQPTVLPRSGTSPEFVEADLDFYEA
jgi:hypothetical protein